MQYALIKNNAVHNVIECDQSFADSIAHEWDAVVPSQGSGVGWEYASGVFTAPARHVNPSPNRKDAILTRLAEIDATSDKPRTRRELALSRAATKTWLQALDDEAVALRTELAAVN